MQPKTARSPASGAETPSTASILVIDDDESMCNLLQRMLEKKGFAVVTATSGRDGIARFRERPADVVVTDIMMPGIDGIDVIRTLRGQWPDVRIIAVSGMEYPHLFMARSCGAKATLRKPVPSGQLVETVQRVLAA